MAREEHTVGSNTIKTNIRLTTTSNMNITVVKGNGKGIESPVGQDARVYVSSDQFKALKEDLVAQKRVVVGYDAVPKPLGASKPSYEELSGFSHYTT